MRSQRGTRWLCPPVLSLLLAALAACGDGGGGTIGVTLQEWAVIPAEGSVGAGEVTFEVENTGPEHHHEFVVISTDLTPNALPTNPDRSVNQGGEGIEVIGEIDEFPPGETTSATFDLEPGNYVLVCNLVEEHEGEVIAHYRFGMFAGFTVE